jgi:hypothetical protein
MERRSREDQAVEQGDGEARLDAAGQRPKGEVSRRAVEINAVADPGEGGRDDPGTGIDLETDVADQRLIEDRLDGPMS